MNTNTETNTDTDTKAPQYSPTEKAEILAREYPVQNGHSSLSKIIESLARQVSQDEGGDFSVISLADSHTPGARQIADNLFETTHLPLNWKVQAATVAENFGSRSALEIEQAFNQGYPVITTFNGGIIAVVSVPN